MPEKCVLEILVKNKLIKVDKGQRYLNKTGGLPLCLPSSIIKLDISKPKFNNKLRKLLEEEGYMLNFSREYENKRIYECVKKDDIRKFIKKLPKQESITLDLSQCFGHLRGVFKEIIKEEFENLNYEYERTFKTLTIKNLEIQNKRKEKEENEDEEALKLLEKIW